MAGVPERDATCLRMASLGETPLVARDPQRCHRDHRVDSGLGH
jgi:hypothetical protein